MSDVSIFNINSRLNRLTCQSVNCGKSVGPMSITFSDLRYLMPLKPNQCVHVHAFGAEFFGAAQIWQIDHEGG